MNKFKKISFILIMMVAVFATIIINSSALVLVDGKFYDNHPNIPSISNTIFYDLNSSPSNPNITIRANATTDYWYYNPSTAFMTSPTGDLTTSARTATFYYSDDDVSAYGLGNYASISDKGVLFIRTQSFSMLDSDIVAGRPLIAVDGVEGINYDNLIGVSIRGGSIDSPTSNLTKKDYLTQTTDYNIKIKCTDLISGESFVVTRSNLDNSDVVGGPTRFYEINPFVLDGIQLNGNIDNSHYAIVLDSLNVHINNTNGFGDGLEYTHCGFDVAFTWRRSYAEKTNVNPISVALNTRDIYTPFNENLKVVAAEIRVGGYNDGYEAGYDDGFEAVGLFGFIINGVEGFLSAELFPGFSFGLLLMSVCGLGLLVWFLKIFAGG